MCLFSVVMLFGISIMSGTSITHASTTDGTIESTNRYAYMEAGSWIDLGSTEGNVHVTDAGLTGYAWSGELGWVSLSCSNDSSCGTVDYGVANDAEGTLSGYAYSETAGWIDWAPTGGGVTIDDSGVFSGRAWGHQVGWITFGCATDASCATVDYEIVTDWRPLSVRTASSPSPSGDSGSISGSSSRTRRGWWTIQTQTSDDESVQDQTAAVSEVLPSIIDAIVPDFLRPRRQVTDDAEVPVPDVSERAPQPLSGAWKLVPVSAVREFVFAPLPQDIRTLAARFPSFGRMLEEVGVSRLSDLDKLQGAKLSLPGLSAQSGVSLEHLPELFKEALPVETIFARAASETIDLPMAVVIDDAGDVSQKIRTMPGKKVTLAIKPESAASAVTGYLAFRSRGVSAQAEREYGQDMLAFVLASLPIFARETDASQAPVSEEMIVQEFNYDDDDGDGIWTADVDTPVVAGEYEVVTFISYRDPEIGVRQVRLITLVDPEGYVYEEIAGKETRVPDAVVTMYEQDDTGAFVLWNASRYHQDNPQTTGVSGSYSFLVPPGTYRISVSAPGYKPYQGQTFEVKVGAGVHENIELIAERGWLASLDWKLVLLVVAVLMLAHHFYRDRRRDRGQGASRV